MAYMYNKELFKISMAVMVSCKLREKEDPEFAERTKDLCRDIEYSRLAFEVYNRRLAKAKNDQKDPNATIKYCRLSEFSMTDTVLDSIDDIRNLPIPSGNDDSDCWLGVSCADYLGLPGKKDVMAIVRQALYEFAADEDCGYIGEIIDKHPEWEQIKRTCMALR